MTIYLTQHVISKNDFVHVDFFSFKVISSAFLFCPGTVVLWRTHVPCLCLWNRAPESQGLGPGHPQAWPGTLHTVRAHVALVELNVKGKVAPCAQVGWARSSLSESLSRVREEQRFSARLFVSRAGPRPHQLDTMQCVKSFHFALVRLIFVITISGGRY